MKKTYKLSIPYLGKVAVVTVVSFSCAISAYQLSQNSSIFSPRSKALELKNNQVIFSNQDQQTHTHQEPDESQYLKENQQSLDKISQTNLNNSPYLFKNQGRVDPTKIYGQIGLGVNGNNTIGVNPNGTGGIVDGKEITMELKVGDKVIFQKYAGTEVKIEGNEYTILRQSDILAVVE